jgi:hypothetical protein
MVKLGPFPYADDMVSVLTQHVAVIHPELSITFEIVDFFASAVKGLIQNLNLDPVVEEEAQRRRQVLIDEDMVSERRRAAAAAAAENGVDDGADAEDDVDG